MTKADKHSVPDRIFMELRTGDVLTIGNTTLRMEYKKGKTARMEICAGRDTVINKKIAPKPTVPSLPS